MSVGHETTISSLSFDYTTGLTGTNSSNSSASGLDVSYIYISKDGSNGSVKNVKISRCYMNGIYLGEQSSALVQNCYISTVNKLGKNASGIFKNNIIFSGGSSQASSSLIYDHNIFLIGFTVDYATLSNNIIINGTISSSSDHSTFVNNIIFNPQNIISLPIGSDFNTGSNNILNTNPAFINKEGSSFLPQKDNLHLLPSSPGIKARTDGTDIGIYGGSSPWVDGGTYESGNMYSIMPKAPQTNDIFIHNVVVPVGGKLKVSTKGVRVR